MTAPAASDAAKKNGPFHAPEGIERAAVMALRFR